MWTGVFVRSSAVPWQLAVLLITELTSPALPPPSSVPFLQVPGVPSSAIPHSAAPASLTRSGCVIIFPE